jgi:hypothetical protein
MKKLLFSFFLLATVVAFAGNTTTKKESKAEVAVLSVAGNVIDEVSGEALVGVELTVEGTDLKTYTDFDGHFVIDNLKAGEYKLVASYTSYNKKQKTLQLKSQNNQVKIELNNSK